MRQSTSSIILAVFFIVLGIFAMFSGNDIAAWGSIVASITLTSASSIQRKLEDSND